MGKHKLLGYINIYLHRLLSTYTLETWFLTPYENVKFQPNSLYSSDDLNNIFFDLYFMKLQKQTFL